MMDAFHILNEDCWREIFGLLEPVELYHCSLVCERFDGILQEKKMDWMLGVVLPFLIPYLERNEPNPLLLLPKKRIWKGLYKLRLVCKMWRGAIDSFMSRDSQSFSGPVALADNRREEDEGFSELLWQEGPGWNRFTDNVKLAEFIEAFGNTETNPFPGRKAIIYDLMVDENEEGEWGWIEEAIEANALVRRQFKERRGELLQKFGRFLWHVQLGWNHERQEANKYQKQVIACLSHLPNIRELTVGSADRLRRGLYQIWGCDLVAELPELRDLRTLVFEATPLVLGLALLIKYGPQVTELEMRSKYNNYFFFSTKMCRMTSLRDLSITLLNTHFNKLFVALRVLPSPLEKLKLVIFLIRDMRLDNAEFVEEEKPYTIPPIFRIDQLFIAIAHLPLTTLTIETHQHGEISGLPIPDNLTIERFNLKVKFYDWTAPPTRISFDFLAKMKSLTNFHLGIEFYYEEGIEMISSIPGRVRVCEYIADNELGLMYESNIWETVPSLKTFSIKFDYIHTQRLSKRIYTRREYQMVMDRMAYH